MNSLLCFSLVVCVCVAAAASHPYRAHRGFRLVSVGDLDGEESNVYPQAVVPAYDLEGAASEHGHLGRVQIKVYRGPTTHHGHDHFAPHGFWVKQPADDHHH